MKQPTKRVGDDGLELMADLVSEFALRRHFACAAKPTDGTLRRIGHCLLRLGSAFNVTLGLRSLVPPETSVKASLPIVTKHRQALFPVTDEHKKSIALSEVSTAIASMDCPPVSVSFITKS